MHYISSILLSFTFLFSESSLVNIDNETMIVGGTEVDPACPDCKYPFMVSLKVDGFGHYCGGSLIRDDWVITAAHCVTQDWDFSVPMNPDNITAEIGLHNVYNTAGSEVYEVDQIIIHPNWNYANNIDADYALLHLTTPSSFEPLQLITQDEHDNEPYMANIMGWGNIYYDGPPSSILLEVYIPIDDDCGNYSDSQITDNHMCAGDTDGGENTCHGDSGGPLIITNEQGEYEQVGIVSWAYGCADAGYPTVYSRIWPQLDWFFSYIGIPFEVELYGDVNFDGIIDVTDLIIVINFILHANDPTMEEFLTADMNQDSIINILDAIQIISAILEESY